MLIFPAIDLIDGQAVRLFQGDYGKKQVFGSDPAAFAARFEKEGARCLHLVDLNGAKAGSPQNFDTVRSIRAAGGLFIELGGGVRSAETVQACFEAGVDRVILGTAALKDPAFTRAMVRQHGGKIAVGVDAREGRVAIEGWLQTSTVDAFNFCVEMMNIGVKHIIFTDISRDGAMTGTNLKAYERLAGLDGVRVTASGGVSTLEEIRALREMGLYAAILGTALYTDKIRLAEAIEAAGPQLWEDVT